jgi:3-deoxy-D-manno-octulosonic-acid transferase
VSVAWSAYRAIAPVLGAAAPAAGMLASPAERALWAERLGRVPEAPAADAWIHAASLGEALAAGPLVRELTALDPRARFHLTATTRGGRGRLAALGHPRSLAPVDAPQAVRRFLQTVRPRRLLLIETELWPHWLIAARAARIPVAVVSARLSESSLRGYAWLGGPFRSLVGGLAGVLCQTAADEARWRRLGAPAERTAVVGNLKTDALPEPAEDRARARAALGLDPARPLLVLGNLRPGVGAALARAWRGIPGGLRAGWQVAAVPRHPHAAAEIRDELRRAGQEAGEGAPREGAWRWDATLGTLPRWYAAADVAVVGGTIGPWGGHNPLEPAACGAAVIVGPHHHAQAEGVAALRRSGGALIVADEAGLVAALARLLGDESFRSATASAALATVREGRGAARRAAARLALWGLWPAS